MVPAEPFDCQSGIELVLVEPRQPFELARQRPVAPAEQLHRRRQEHAANHGRVEQDRCGQANSGLLHSRERDVVKREKTATITSGSQETTVPSGWRASIPARLGMDSTVQTVAVPCQPGSGSLSW
jgi:hypothetical protein